MLEVLILRVTNRCNFKCSFCSASNLSSKHTMTLDQVKGYIIKYNPKQLCFEGGEPLMVPPSFYIELFNWIDNNPDLRIEHIGITSNLWPFYKNPEKWVPVLSHSKVHLSTSFQYGTGRKITDNKVYTEHDFISVIEKVKQYIPQQYPLTFISVISDENSSTIDQTIQLAKRLGLYVKINPAYPVGRVVHGYPLDKMIEHYTDIIVSGNHEIEDNCGTLMRLLFGVPEHTCMWNIDCSQGMRTINPDGVVSVCSMDNSQAYQLTLKGIPIVTNDKGEHDITKDNNAVLVSAKCLSCRWYRVCNSCHMHVRQIKNMTHQRRNQHCHTIAKCCQTIINYMKEHTIEV